MRAILACVLLLSPLRAADAAEGRLTPTVPSAPAGFASPAGETATLGRLFYTPAQRAALDEMRRRPQVVAHEPKSQLPPPPEYVTLNGIVRRNDGATTVWLNDKPVRGRASAEGLQVAPNRRTGAGDVTVHVPQTGRTIDLKVGQQLEVNSGEVKERYRAPTPPPGPETFAEARLPAPVPDASSARDRRASREREALRDLLREIESPPSPAAPAPPSASMPPR